MKFLDKFEEYVLLVCFPLMVLLILLATFSRYFQIGSFPWAEEAARYLMIISAFAGISYGFKLNSHLGLSFFVNRTSGTLRKVLELVRTVAVVAFGVIVGYQSYVMISKQMKLTQNSPSLHIPMWIVYIPILVGCILIAVRSIQSYVTHRSENQEVL